MPAATGELAIEAALETERQLVLTLGGFALEVAGAALVTHEKIPAPRFNFVQELGVGPERQTAFFERALDHYFQRALRPAFRVPLPVPAHVDRGLRRFRFVPRPDPLTLLLESDAPVSPEVDGVSVRTARPSEAEALAAFWSDEGERPELRAAIDVAWQHPNPHEQFVPLIALDHDEVVAAAVVYRYREAAGIYFVATRAPSRGHGAASALVAHARAARPTGPDGFLSIFSDSPRLERRLRHLGFAPARRFVEYVLPPDAELSLPPPGPPGPPRWRPPR